MKKEPDCSKCGTGGGLCHRHYDATSSFSPQDFTNVIRSQMHGRTFPIFDAKIVSIEYGKTPGQLHATVCVETPDDPVLLKFEIQIKRA